MKMIKHSVGDYKRQRERFYPPLADFADAFVAAYADNPTAVPAPLRDYVKACLAVKEKFPKK